MRSSSVTTRLPRPRWRGMLRQSAGGSRCQASSDDPPPARVGRPEDVPGLMFVDAAGATLPYLILALVAAATVSFLLTPVIRRIAIRYDAIDHPGLRRVNEIPVPRGGGVAVSIAFITVAVALLTLNSAIGFVPVPTNVELIDLIGLLLGGALATAFGVIDDSLDLRARWQFVG